MNYYASPLSKNLSNPKYIHLLYSYSSWGADLAGMQLINKSNKGHRF